MSADILKLAKECGFLEHELDDGTAIAFEAFYRAAFKAAQADNERLRFALAETQALEMQHGAVIERLLNQQQNGSPVVEGTIQHQAMEIARMRHRIECLRGGLKSASGWLLDVGDLDGADKCMAMAGDMEPPLNDLAKPPGAALCDRSGRAAGYACDDKGEKE